MPVLVFMAWTAQTEYWLLQPNKARNEAKAFHALAFYPLLPWDFTRQEHFIPQNMIIPTYIHNHLICDLPFTGARKYKPAKMERLPLTISMPMVPEPTW